MPTSERRSALITGASGGMGSAIAAALAEEGFWLTITGRDLDKLEQTRREVLKQADVDVQIVAGDIADGGFLRRLVEAHVGRFGAIDVLSNNAGVVRPNSIAEESDEDIDAQLTVNLRSLIVLTREAIPHLLRAADERGRAHVFNTASNAGLRGELSIATYSATKAGVVKFTEAIHQEYSMKGIRATALCPGLTDSAMTEMYRDAVPQEDMVDPRDIAEGVRFVLRCRSNCIVPELVFLRDAEWLDGAPEHAE